MPAVRGSCVRSVVKSADRAEITTLPMIRIRTGAVWCVRRDVEFAATTPITSLRMHETEVA